MSISAARPSVKGYKGGALCALLALNAASMNYSGFRKGGGGVLKSGVS